MAKEASDGMDQWLAPFSPLILRSRLPDDVLAVGLEDTDRLLGDLALQAKHREESLVLSNVRDHVELPAPTLAGPFGRAIESVCERYVRRAFETRVDLTEFTAPPDPSTLGAEVHVAWVNRQVAGDFVPLHKHSADLSGVCYLKIPEGMGTEIDQGGQITFFDGRPQPLVREKVSFRPSRGEIFCFPGWLGHMVYPFRCAGERRIVSFNAFIRW